MSQHPGQVGDNPDDGQFEVNTEGGLAVLTYDRREGKLHLLHTGVPEEAEGKGVGGRLVQAALEQAREQGLKVVPHCSFARAYVARHPEYADVVQAPE